MTLSISEVFTAATQSEHLKQLLANASTLGLRTTSFRPGDISLALITLFSYAEQNADAIVSLISQGGLLDWAATGTVTLSLPDGTTVTRPVSPDPSDPSQNPTGAKTWLDALAEQNYDTTRIGLTTAGGALAIVNTSASTYGPFAAGDYHVSNAYTGAGYSNIASLTIAPSALVGTAITGAVTAGGLIKLTFSAAHGLTTGDPLFVQNVGGTTEANGAWYVTVVDATHVTLDGSTFVNAYTAGGTARTPTVATCAADEAGSTYSSYDGSGVLNVHTVTQAVTSLVGVAVDNLDVWEGTDIESNTALRDRAKLKLKSVSVNGPTGAYEYFALSAVEYAPLLDPPRTMSSRITRVLTVPDLLTGYVQTWIATAAGAPTSDDVTTVNLILQARCVPLGVTALTAAATEVAVAAVFHIYLPAAYATDANKVLFQAAVQAYFSSLDIGGLSDPGGAYTHVVPIEDVKGVIYETAKSLQIRVDNVTATLNGGTSNIALTVSTTQAQIAVLSPAVPTITLHPT